MASSRPLLRASSTPLLLAAVIVAFSLWLAPASASAAGWVGFSPVTGSPGAGRTATQPKLASDAAGNQVAVWVEQPSPFKVVAAFRPAGGDWGPAQALDAAATTLPAADVAVDSSGNFVVVYNETIGTSYRMLANYLPAGQATFGPIEQLQATGSTAVMTAPAVAFDPQGRALAVFGIQGSNEAAFRRPTGAGQPWSSVNTGLGASGAAPDLVIDGSGVATIADVAAGALRHFRLPGGGAAWTNDTTPNASPNPTGTPVIAVDSQGRTTTVVLLASTFTQIAAYTCPAGVGAACNARTQFTQLGAISSAGSPALAVDAAGDAVASWTESCSTGGCAPPVAISRRSGFAGAWSAPVQIGTGNGAALAFDPAGNAMAVYEQSTSLIKFSLATAGSGFSPPSVQLTDPATQWITPKLAGDAGGDFFGVWAQATGAGIQSAVYDVQPPAIQTFTVPTGVVASRERAFAAAASDTWSGVSYAWDFGDGGTATGASVAHTYGAPGTYTARMTASDGAGNQASQAQVVDVSAAPTAPVLARPVAGQTVNLELVSGVVLVKVPGSNRFVPLTAPSQVKTGSIIDARKGRVRITIDNGRGGYDTADFYGGIFKFTQPAVKAGQTSFANLYLHAGSFKGCPRAPRHPKIASVSRKAAKKQSRGKSVRHLWGSGEGAFRTVGRYSSATVRGTTWLTDDRCKGTLTKVTTGKVGVRDFVLRKTVVVRKGKSYFASAKGKVSRKR